MSRKGWVKIWHKLADDPMWLEEPFTKGQAWVDLIMIATTVESETPGRVHCSISWLANRWKWSRDKVRTYLKRLEKDGKIRINIDRQKNRQYFRQDSRHLLTIEKYGAYQLDRQSNRQENRQNSRHIEEDIDGLSSGSINEPERKKSGKDRKRVEKSGDDKRIPDYAKDKFPDFESYKRWLKERL